MKKITFLLFGICLHFLVFAQNTLIINKTASVPTIDGIKTASEPWSDNWITMDKINLNRPQTNSIGKFQLFYNDTYLFILVNVNDDTPSNDETLITGSYLRDCIDLYLSMDTITGDGRYRDGTWQIRKQRESSDLGLAGSRGMVGGGNNGLGITPLTGNGSGFSCVSNSSSIEYTQEWAIPWNVLSADMPNGWDKKHFRFDICRADNDGTNYFDRALSFWNSSSDFQWYNTKYMGIAILGDFKNRKEQTISFANIPELPCGTDGYVLKAESNLGLSISYSSSNSSIAQVKGNKITAIGVGTCTITAAQAGNDTVNPAVSVSKNITIIKGSQILTFVDTLNHKYGDIDFIPAKTNTNLIVSLKSDNDTVASIINNKVHIKSAGSVKIKAWQNGNANYIATDTIERIITIEKATLKVVADNQSRFFGQKNPILSVSYSGFKYSDGLDDITKAVASCLADSLSSVGVYDIILSGRENKKYKFELVNAKLTILKANLKIKVKDLFKTYGDVNPKPEFILEGKANGDNEKDIELPKVELKCDEKSPAGVYDVLLTGSNTKNYTVNTQNSIIVVLKAPLYITVDEKIMKLSDSIPQFTMSLGGFVNNEDTSILTEHPVLSCNSTKESPVGEYNISVSGGSAENYIMIYKNAKLKIVDNTDVESSSEKISFYPNPTKGLVYFSGLKTGKYDISIYTLQGKLVMKKCFEGYSLNVQSLVRGTYFCKIANSGIDLCFMLVKE